MKLIHVDALTFTQYWENPKFGKLTSTDGISVNPEQIETHNKFSARLGKEKIIPYKTFWLRRTRERSVVVEDRSMFINKVTMISGQEFYVSDDDLEKLTNG